MSWSNDVSSPLLTLISSALPNGYNSSSPSPLLRNRSVGAHCNPSVRLSVCLSVLYGVVTQQRNAGETSNLAEMFVVACMGVGAQSTLGVKTFLHENKCMKNQQNARILHDICPKNIFPIFLPSPYLFA